MGFWQWFASDERVARALEQATDYDISPVVIVPPAVNMNVPQTKNHIPPVVEATTGLRLDREYTPELNRAEGGDLWGDGR